MVVNAGRALGRQGSGSGELGLEFPGVKPRILTGRWGAEIGGFRGRVGLERAFFLYGGNLLVKAPVRDRGRA